MNGSYTVPEEAAKQVDSITKADVIAVCTKRAVYTGIVLGCICWFNHSVIFFDKFLNDPVLTANSLALLPALELTISP